MKGGSLGSMIARNGQGGCNCGTSSQPNPQATQIGNAIGGIFGHPQAQPQAQPQAPQSYPLMSDAGGWGGEYNRPQYAQPQANIFQRGMMPQQMSMFKGLFG